MRVARTYTIEEEYLRKLKGINASELINNLLSEYFIKTNNNNDDLALIEFKAKQAIEVATKEIEIVEEKKAEIINLEEQEKLDKERQEKREKTKFDERNEIFKADVGRDMTVHEYKAFEEGFKAGQWNIMTFIEIIKENERLQQSGTA